LKRFIAYKVISKDLKNPDQDIGNIVEAALHWVGFRNFLGMMTMTYGEYRDIKELNYSLIQKYQALIHFYYGSNDKWVPIQFYH
jgi:hypothetical protein